MTPPTTPTPRARALAAALLTAAAVVGCGIRTTDVPVDGGPAPMRATCDVAAPLNGDGIEVFLLCGSRVESVQRATEVPGRELAPGSVAKALLRELQSDPDKEEEAAGFRTDVPLDLHVSSPPGDTVGSGENAEPVLRLSKGPGELPVSALYQIICTFARSERLGNGQSVVLGGPPGSSSEVPKAYTCSAAARASGQGRPETPPVLPPGSRQDAGEDPTG